MLRYPCLVLDHDDTVVQSTPLIHYPSFMNTLEQLRPGVHWSLQEFIGYNFELGFEAMCRELLGFTPEEMAVQEQNWLAYASTHEPLMFPGMAALIRRQKAEGGLVCAVSHSDSDVIARDYRKSCGFEPDLIFGWEQGPGRRKPHPWPLRQIMERYALAPAQLLMVDDLKPGWQMAQACEVPFAFAGWGSPVPAIHAFMHEHADYFLTEVEQLERLLFGAQG